MIVWNPVGLAWLFYGILLIVIGLALGRLFRWDWLGTIIVQFLKVPDAIVDIISESPVKTQNTFFS